jgi:hypothetical protein
MCLPDVLPRLIHIHIHIPLPDYYRPGSRPAASAP